MHLTRPVHLGTTLPAGATAAGWISRHADILTATAVWAGFCLIFFWSPKK